MNADHWNCFYFDGEKKKPNIMSKLKQHITDAQKQIIKIKERHQKYVPGTINLQILGSGAPGAPATIYLFTDQSR